VNKDVENFKIRVSSR